MREHDSHQTVLTGSGWQFVTPADQGGLYHISANVSFVGAANWNPWSLILFKNGAAYRRLGRLHAGTMEISLSIGHDVALAPGDTIDLRLYPGISNGRLVGGGIDGEVASWITIYRVPGS